MIAHAVLVMEEKYKGNMLVVVKNTKKDKTEIFVKN